VYFNLGSANSLQGSVRILKLSLFLVSRFPKKFNNYLKFFLFFLSHLKYVIDVFHLTPGGQLRYKSYNTSTIFTSYSAAPYTAFVLNASYFANVANISRIEFVPMSAGSLVIEVNKAKTQ
jgi:hypothetical protein